MMVLKVESYLHRIPSASRKRKQDVSSSTYDSVIPDIYRKNNSIESALKMHHRSYYGSGRQDFPVNMFSNDDVITPREKSFFCRSVTSEDEDDEDIIVDVVNNDDTDVECIREPSPIPSPELQTIRTIVYPASEAKTLRPPPLIYCPSGSTSENEEEDRDYSQPKIINLPTRKYECFTRTTSCPNIRKLSDNHSKYCAVDLTKRCFENNSGVIEGRCSSCPPSINSCNVSHNGATSSTEHSHKIHQGNTSNIHQVEADNKTIDIECMEPDAKRVKQEKNKEASKNYRDRKKQKHTKTQEKESELKTRNESLRTQIKDIEHDIAAFENDLAKKINTKEKIRQQICTLLLRDMNGYSRDMDVERAIMQRILERITGSHSELVKQAFYEILVNVSEKQSI